MLTQIRHIQKGTLIVVTILIVIAFAFLYSDFDFVQGTVGGQQCAVKVYDRCYRQKEVQKLASFYDVALQMRMAEFATVLFGENRQDQDRTDFVLSLIILRAEAEKLGIEPTAEEIKSAVPNLPIFQNAGITADMVERNILGPNGFTDGDFAQLVKDYLSFEKLRDLIGVGVAAIPSETNLRYVRANQRFNASVIEFNREKAAKDVKITAEEIQEYFDENSENLKTDPRRGFKFAKFEPLTLPEDATNEQISKADLAFANAVNRAYPDLADGGADFLKVAKQYEGKQADFSMASGSFEPFTQQGPPKDLDGNESLLSSLFSGAFQLEGVSVPVETGEGGYYVFYFSDEVDPQPLDLKTAKPAIEKALTAKQSNRVVSDAASAARAALNEALEAGKPFDEAAQIAKVLAKPLPNFSAQEPPVSDYNADLILNAVIGLSENEVSEVVEQSAGAGFLLLYVKTIELYEDEEEDATKRSITAQTELGLKRTLFTGWFNQRKLESASTR